MGLAVLLGGCVSGPPEPASAPADEGARLLQRGVRSLEAGRYHPAARDFDRALAYYRGLDDARGAARSHIDLAALDLRIGQSAAAERHLHSARDRLHRLDNADRLSARIDLLASSAALARDEAARANDLIAPHLPAFGDDRGDDSPLDRRTVSFIANRTAVAFRRPDDDPDRWTQRLAQALAQLPAEAPGLQARLERFRARRATSAAHYDQAAGHYRKALAIYRRADLRSGIAACLEHWAQLDHERGKADAARDHLDRALDVRIALRDTHGTRANLQQRLQLLQPAGKQRTRLQRWRTRLDHDGAIDWSALRGAAHDRNTTETEH